MGMLITNEFDISQPVDAVWEFFQRIDQVAKCLPGTQLTADLGNDEYKGEVLIAMGPIKLKFNGDATITEKDQVARKMVIDASGSEATGKGQAAMLMTASLVPAPTGTHAKIDMDLDISGAAAQYGRGMVSDVTKVLLSEFAKNMQNRVTAIQQGRDPDSVGSAKAASGFGIVIQAATMALKRLFSRFCLPYNPSAS